MSFTKKILGLVLVVAMAVPIVGCSSVGKSPAEIHRTAVRSIDYDRRMLLDDLLLLIQLDGTVRTSRWVID